MPQMRVYSLFLVIFEEVIYILTKISFLYLQRTLNPRADVSPSGSLSPGPSTGGLVPSPLSAEVRRERDRKHLNDITAARLPPLHHSPAQMLSLHESACLLQDQTEKQLVRGTRTASTDGSNTHRHRRHKETRLHVQSSDMTST